MLEVFTKSFPPKEVDIKEVLRYMGITGETEISPRLKRETDDVINECLPKLKYSVCYTETPISVTGNRVDFPFASVESKSLSSHLALSEKAVIFASTIGLEIDRLIYKYGKISPSDSLILQALGTERIESLCDSFCEFIATEESNEGFSTVSRYSAGYGDFPLSFQREIFSALKPESKIMLTLNESLIMSPSKSVTAVIGIGKTIDDKDKKCKSCGDACNKTDCIFRSE